MKTEPDFETQWQAKLEQALSERAPDAGRAQILSGGQDLSDQSPARDRLAWTCQALERLGEEVDLETRQQILADCHCSYPLRDLLEVKMTYRVSGDIDRVLLMLGEQFESFLREGLQLEEGLVSTIIERGWGLAGRREGKTILATKIPKSGFIREYFQERDPQKKRQLYCHCPRVRDAVGAEPGLPIEYCSCGAGFYQGIWQEILGQPVQVEILESVLQGDDVCTIKIHLPGSRPV